MIKLIVGLGNPGSQYQGTRHNAGFLFLDRLVSINSGAVWRVDRQFCAELSEIIVSGRVLVMKPTTFMNKSGQAVAKMASFYKIKPSEILVLHDELELSVGQVKMKFGGGHAGHNGLRDIIAQIGSADFYRLRIGIGRPTVGSVADYVLSKPSIDVQHNLEVVGELIASSTKDLLSVDVVKFNERFA
jgi:PTH1 family peptidyl-tRNA hydrolase